MLITLDNSNYPLLLRITPDYQFGSPSGPADYLSCFPIGITADYCALLRNTPIYSILLRFTSDYRGLLRITPDYSGLLRITPKEILSYLKELKRIKTYRVLIYKGKIISGTKDFQTLHSLRRIEWEKTPKIAVQRILITLDDSNYPVPLRITPDYQFGSPSGPGDYLSCVHIGITADYPGLPRITSDYFKLLGF